MAINGSDGKVRTRELLYSLTRKDFDIDWFSGKGAGGQHRNKHQNCVRITHRDSGFTEIGQSHKSRKRNFEEAFERLAERIANFYMAEETRDRFPKTDVVRTYNVIDNRVTDHKTGTKFSYESFDLDDVIRRLVASGGEKS